MIADPRVIDILAALEDIAAGDLARRLEISPAHDHCDAIAHAINVVAGELDYTTRNLARARDEAERASHAKSVFLRNVSHELRTPLSAILTMTQLLQEGRPDPARTQTFYARIIANVNALAELLDDVLDLSQVESGKLALDLQQISVSALLGEVAASMESLAHEKGIALDLEGMADPPVDLHVLADRKVLRQVLVNLIGNAIKFTSNGSVVVRAGREGRDVVVDVVDTGIGIDPAHADRLFEPFSQAEPSIGRRFGGSGLGLALARRLAREMGGDVAITATSPDRGSTFRVRLPECAVVGANHALEPAGHPSAPQPTLAGVCVLLVDDDDDIRIPLAALLELRGATILQAANGREAIELGARAGIDVILMDIRMPEVDGLEATRQLRALGVRTPIIAVTADVVGSDHRIFADAGCTTQVAKPLDVEQLTALVLAVTSSPLP